jgi:hypothetical protein
MSDRLLCFELWCNAALFRGELPARIVDEASQDGCNIGDLLSGFHNICRNASQSSDIAGNLPKRALPVQSELTEEALSRETEVLVAFVQS